MPRAGPEAQRRAVADDGTIHDRHDAYAWDDAFAVKIAALNAASFAGHDDWRVPNVKELQSLIEYGSIAPAVSPAFTAGCSVGCTVLACSCTSANPYWSSRRLAPAHSPRTAKRSK